MRIALASTALIHAVCLLGLALPSAAQVQRGAIYGTVHDSTGAVLPGVVLHLTSPVSAPQEAATGARGEFRFPDLDPSEYTLRATLEGFRPVVRPAVIVGVGVSVEIRIDMAVADVTEEIVVSAATPVLDLRRQGNVTNFDQAMLNEIPTARDPWTLMQQLPGVSIGRPNVGGSESSNQAQFAARGDNGSNTMWNIDGVTITDMAAGGASTTFYDFNVFEEAQYTTGSLDARQQTGGLGINLVTKRGSNDLHGSGRIFFSNDDLQGENITNEQAAAGLTGNRIMQLAEYGGDAGGPLWKERVWFWLATSRTDVRQLAINGYPDNSIINTLATRGDAQLAPSTRLSFLYHRAQKLKDGRAAGLDRPPETTWDQDGATNIYKIEGSQILGPGLLVSAKFAYVDSAFSLTPQSGMNGQAWRDFATQIWHGSFSFNVSDRDQYQTQIDGNWSRGRHDITFGLHQRSTTSNENNGWPGDGTHTAVNLERQGVPTGIGFANITRQGVPASSTSTLSGYIGDVVTTSRWTFNLGVRFDRQRGRNEASGAPANGLAPTILPALEYPGDAEIGWNDFSPRLGVTYRLTDRTILRGSYARFANQLASSLITFDNAAGQSNIQYFFRDANGDRLAQASELLEPTGTVMSVNPADPAAPFSPNQVDPALSAPSLQTVIAGVEREVMPNFSLGVNFGHGYVSNTTWPSFIGLTREDFVEYRTAGAAGGVTSTTPVYRLASGTSLPPGNGRLLSNRDGYHQRYWNVDLVGTKRLSNRWMVRGFLTLQQQRESFDDPARAIQDPTPRYDQAPGAPGLVSGFLDGGLAVNAHPGSEFVINAKWMYSVAGLYELPWGINVAGTVYGRQGYPAFETISVNRPDGLGLTSVLVDADLDASRYSSVQLVDLRVQKTLEWRGVRATLDLDLFNAFNSGVILRQFREATATTFRRPQEIVAPRLIRLGLQLQF
jgi:Carboxypeptidase regulatory-like domain/TonB dependent receptor/TonB-dependent Receptor Plug Domain